MPRRSPRISFSHPPYSLLFLTLLLLLAAFTPVVSQGPEAVLGVPRDASLSAVRSAFRRRSLELHPDKKDGSAAKFLKLQKGLYKLARMYIKWRRDRPVSTGTPVRWT